MGGIQLAREKTDLMKKKLEKFPSIQAQLVPKNYVSLQNLLEKKTTLAPTVLAFFGPQPTEEVKYRTLVKTLFPYTTLSDLTYICVSLFLCFLCAFIFRIFYVLHCSIIYNFSNNYFCIGYTINID